MATLMIPLPRRRLSVKVLLNRNSLQAMKLKLPHWLFNGVLLLLAIAAWFVFVMGRKPTQSVETLLEALNKDGIGRHLPQTQSNLQVWIDQPDGNKTQVLPRFQMGKPITFGDDEMHQIDLLVKLSLYLGTAQKASRSDSWKRLGEIRFSSKSSPDQFVVPMYRVATDKIGFEWRESRYESVHPISQDLLLVMER